ncbi:hypothetical protein T459_19418 [Capsicum annuum]|uniref:VAN3-binding protein-like auxin canalisation domain-containing protein n=1 Tax=Capsicum annuum TaxID=4072 RepID=A0A2G2Z1M7_CAPAN|nr:hypothetical protein T459_19418 [Capsicum annuum]
MYRLIISTGAVLLLLTWLLLVAVWVRKYSGSLIVATTASSDNGKGEDMAKTDMAVVSAATFVAAQCAEAIGAKRKHLASVISSAVNVRSAGDIMTFTAAAPTGTLLNWAVMSKFSSNLE